MRKMAPDLSNGSVWSGRQAKPHDTCLW